MNDKITILGVGRLGLCLALVLERCGYDVVGIDTLQKYIDQLNNKTFKSMEPELMNLLKESSNFRAITDLEEGLKHSNIIFIVVPTPNTGGEQFYNHSIVSNVLFDINRLKVKNKHLIICCTVMPGYIDRVAKCLLDDCDNCTLSYNPEFISQGDIIKGLWYPDIILVGTYSDELKVIIKQIYNKINKNTPEYKILTPLEAEITKLSINGFITTKISFANMISDTCDNVGADKHKVLDAVGGDSRIGTKYFKPGYSFGGPCFPRDTKALELFINQNIINSDILISTTKYNESHIDYQTRQLLQQNKKEYIIENICYKENSKIPIIEESAKLKIAKRLVDHGVKVTIKDEEHMIHEVKKEYGNIFDYIITYQSILT